MGALCNRTWKHIKAFRRDAAVRVEASRVVTAECAGQKRPGRFPMDAIAEWIKHQQRTAGHRPAPLLVEAVTHVTVRQSALDLGAGSLDECDFPLNAGFQNVVAVDITPQFKPIDPPPGARFEYHQRAFDQYCFPTDSFDLISA